MCAGHSLALRAVTLSLCVHLWLHVHAPLCVTGVTPLRCRLRDHTSSVMQDANLEEHALAYLEHPRHGVAVVNLFLTYSGCMKEEARRGFRVVVHSRFYDRADPLMDAPILCLDAALQRPHIDLRLYNHTGNCVS